MLAWLKDGTADWFWPAAEKAGLPVMFLAFGMLNQFDPIAQRHPGAAADHRPHGRQHRRSRRRGGWRTTIGQAVALAKYPNVSIKMSNLAEFVAGALSLQGPDPAPEARVRRLRAAALPLGNRRDERINTAGVGASASPISPRRSTSCRRATRTGCWVARSCRSSNGPKFAHSGSKKSLTSLPTAAFAC